MPDNAGTVQVLGRDPVPPAERQQRKPVGAVPAERGEAPAPAPPGEVALVDAAVLVAVEQDRGSLDQRLQVRTGDLHVNAPPHALPLELEPGYDPASVEVAGAPGLVMQPEKTTGHRMVLLAPLAETGGERLALSGGVGTA